MRKVLIAVAVVGCAFSASAYTLDNGVLTVFVDAGNTQTNLLADQLSAIEDSACTEMRKTGVGELMLTSTSKISKFKGTIRISQGILTMNNGSGGGLLGTTDGPTIVEDGATLKTMTYLVWYDHEPLTIIGTGYDNHGSIWHTGTAGAASFGKVTLAGDTTIINDSAGTYKKQFHIRNDVFDMGGYDLTMRGPNGATINVDPTEIVNPGNLTFVGNGWGIPRKAVLDHGTNHTITLEYTGKQGREPHTNYCNWTMKIVNPNCGIRAYTPPFIWDGPLELPDTGTFIFECNAARTTPDKYYMRFNGPISGGSAVRVDTANVNGAANGSWVIFAGTNTYTGGTKMTGNAKGPLVCLVPEAVPGLLDAINAGEFPATSVYNPESGGGSYVHVLAAGARTERNPGGWTDEQIKKLWDAFKGHASCAIYAAPGDSAVVHFDSTTYGALRYPGLAMSGYGGGDVTVVTDWTDGPRFFNNFLGTNIIYSATDGAAAESTIGDISMYSGRVTLRNAGHVMQNGAFYIGTLGQDYYADLVIDAGTVIEYGTNGWRHICIGYRESGACGRMTILPGGVVSNAVEMSASGTYNKEHSAFVQKGGAYWNAYECTASGGKNSSSYIELQAGESHFDHGFRLGINRTSCATFVQTGGDTTSKGFFSGEGSTSTVYVAGGTFHHAGDMYIPRSLQASNSTNGSASVTFANGVEPVVTNKVVLADRVDSTGILNLNGGAMLSAVSVEKQPGATSKGSVPLSGNAAYVNFNGGGLKASAAGDLIKGGDAAIDRATVYEGGAIFDTAGHDVAVQVPLEKPSGSGIASITVTNLTAKYYTAPTVIIFGDGTGASAVVGYDEQSFHVTNVTVTSAGCGYTTATAYLFLYQGKCIPLVVTLGANAETGGLVKKGEGTLTLAGANTYGGDTVVEAGTLKFASSSALPSGSSIISKGGAVGAAEYADVPKTITFDVDDPVDGKRYVLASWDDGVAGAAGDFTVSGLPACWSLAVRNGKLVAAHFRGMMFTVR